MIGRSHGELSRSTVRTAERIELFWGVWAAVDLPHTGYYWNSGISKTQECFLLDLLPKLWTSENFARTHRPLTLSVVNSRPTIVTCWSHWACIARWT